MVCLCSLLDMDENGNMWIIQFSLQLIPQISILALTVLVMTKSSRLIFSTHITVCYMSPFRITKRICPCHHFSHHFRPLGNCRWLKKLTERPAFIENHAVWPSCLPWSFLRKWTGSDQTILDCDSFMDICGVCPVSKWEDTTRNCILSNKRRDNKKTKWKSIIIHQTITSS